MLIVHRIKLLKAWIERFQNGSHTPKDIQDIGFFYEFIGRLRCNFAFNEPLVNFFYRNQKYLTQAQIIDFYLCAGQNANFLKNTYTSLEDLIAATFKIRRYINQGNYPGFFFLMARELPTESEMKDWSSSNILNPDAFENSFFNIDFAYESLINYPSFQTGFFHHHKERCAAVLSALLQCQDEYEVTEILENQIQVLEQKEPVLTLSTPHLDPRWSLAKNLQNKNITNSSFLAALKTCLSSVNDNLAYPLNHTQNYLETLQQWQLPKVSIEKNEEYLKLSRQLKKITIELECGEYKKSDVAKELTPLWNDLENLAKTGCKEAGLLYINFYYTNQELPLALRYGKINEILKPNLTLAFTLAHHFWVNNFISANEYYCFVKSELTKLITKIINEPFPENIVEFIKEINFPQTLLLSTPTKKFILSHAVTCPITVNDMVETLIHKYKNKGFVTLHEIFANLERNAALAPDFLTRCLDISYNNNYDSSKKVVSCST